MTNILLFLCLCLVTNSYRVDATLPMSRREEEIEKQLKLLNKPPIRSFQTKLGDIVDCIDIYKQPAFDHPLLKNHKLQRKPSFLKRKARINEHALPNRTSQFVFEKVWCPKGSVPIRRTTKDDIIAMKNLSCIAHPLTQSYPGSHSAALVMRNGETYTGVNGFINAYNPRVKKYQMSLAQLAVQNGEFDGVNTILVGWQVSPELYHNKFTHFFALWTSDSFKRTGCYNTICPGFVGVDPNAPPLGSRVEHTSTYEGPQFEIPFSILQDSISKNWWLIVQDFYVGYFPAALFSNLSEANLVGWGGRVSGVMKGASPPMGSGHFPDGDLNHACYVRRISYVDESGSSQEPDGSLPNIVVDNPLCYDVEYFGFRDDQNRYTLQFGGPGGYCSTM